MSNVPVSPAFLPITGLNLLSSTDNDEAPADGFQALLNIVDDDIDPKPALDTRKVLPLKQDRKVDAVVGLVDAPQDKVNDQLIKPVDTQNDSDQTKTAASLNKAEQQKDTVDATTKNTKDVSKKTVDTKVDRSSDNKADKASDKKADGAQGSAVVTATGLIHSSGVENPEQQLIAQMDAVREALFDILSQLSGQQVTDVKSAQQALALLSPTGQQDVADTANVSNLPKLPPSLIQQLQALVENIQALSDPALQQTVDVDIDGFIKQVNALLGNDALPSAVGKSDTTLIGQLSEELHKLTKAFEQFTKSHDNAVKTGGGIVIASAGVGDTNTQKQDDLPSSPQALKTISSVASEQTAPQLSTKTDTIQAPATLGQGAAAKIEASLGKSDGGFDFSGGQRDAAGLIGLTRAQNNAAPQATQNAPAFSRLLQQAEQRPVIDQIVFSIRSTPHTGTSRIHIQLQPAELGKVEVKMDVDGDGRTTLTITADNKQTFDMLQRDRSGLERALADAGLKADSGDLNFNLRGEQQGGQEQDNSGYAKHYPLQPQEESITPTDLLTTTYTVDVIEGLDITI